MRKVFYLYTGWGYWCSKLDIDDSDFEAIGGSPDSFYIVGKEQWADRWTLELPELAQKEIELREKATSVDYLLATDDPDIEYELLPGHPVKGELQFLLLEDEPQLNKDGTWDERCVRKNKTITITADEIISKEKWEARLKARGTDNNKPNNEQLSETNKPRKKLKPLQRETNEALLMLDELFKSKNVQYLDDLKAITAWGLIVSGEFESDLIKSVSDNKTILLNGGDKLLKTDFLEKYRKRFK